MLTWGTEVTRLLVVKCEEGLCFVVAIAKAVFLHSVLKIGPEKAMVAGRST